MTYVHDKKKMGKKVSLDKGFGIDKKSKDRAVAVDYVIDTNKRGKNGVNGGEPRMVD